jgi:hypothetical protein
MFDLPDGQIAAVCFAPLSIPDRKNISLYPTGKSSLQAGPSRAHQEGRIAIVTTRWARDAMAEIDAIDDALIPDGEAAWF